MVKTLKTLIGIILLPVAVGTARAFYLAISEISIFSGSLQLLERGVLAYLLFHVLIMRPAYLYVLAHEFVHVIATWICGGKVMSFNVTPSGGNVATSKTNFFIELSPYFIPLYTLLLGPMFLVFRSSHTIAPQASAVFLFLIGFTLAFHFVMTTEVLKIEQSDVAKSGFIFSIVLIFIGNLVIIMAVFSPIFDNVFFMEFIKSSASRSLEIYRQLWQKAIEIAEIAGNWQI